jgi:hypothetical protein
MSGRCAAGRRGRCEAGLTIVEMMLALALLAFVLLGITPLFMASVKSNYSGNEYTSINVLARDRLEQLMNLPFDDNQLTPGLHVNDLPAVLPDPATGIPPTSGGIRSPFRICYQVLQFRIPTGVAANASFVPVPVTTANNLLDYKRIDVTVRASAGQLGPAIGIRQSRVSGILSNPYPERASSLDDAAWDTDVCR